jgi:hypothetical protein
MALDFERSAAQALSLTSFVLPYTTQCSFGGWINPESTPGTNAVHTIFSKGDGLTTTDRNLHCVYWNNAGEVRLAVLWTQPANTFHIYTFVTTLTPGTWVHVCWTIDWTTNPDTLAFYLDGVARTLTLAQGSTNATPSLGGTQNSHIGAIHSSLTLDNWDGMMAELFLYTGVLTPGQVAMLAAGLSPLGLGLRLDSWWPMHVRAGVTDSGALEFFHNRSGIAVTATAAPHPRQVVAPAIARLGFDRYVLSVAPTDSAARALSVDPDVAMDLLIALAATSAARALTGDPEVATRSRRPGSMRLCPICRIPYVEDPRFLHHCRGRSR